MQVLYLVLLAALLLTAPATAETTRMQRDTDAKSLSQIDADDQEVHPYQAKSVSVADRGANVSGCKTICSLLSSR